MDSIKSTRIVPKRLVNGVLKSGGDVSDYELDDVSNLHHNADNLIGREFGRLTVIGLMRERTGTNLRWLCKCRCGTLHTAIGSGMKKRTTSCGCYRSENSKKIHTTHGMTNSRVWRIWKGMIERCHEPAYGKSYALYGGRGIFVCNRWRGNNGFINFLKDMGNPGDSSKLTIDRIDTYDGYYKENCRWATIQQQAVNRTDNRMLTANGKTQPLCEWARETGLKRFTITRRIDFYGWSEERALTTELLRIPRKKRVS